jgi:hypothetical protein
MAHMNCVHMARYYGMRCRMGYSLGKAYRVSVPVRIIRNT